MEPQNALSQTHCQSVEKLFEEFLYHKAFAPKTRVVYRNYFKPFLRSCPNDIMDVKLEHIESVLINYARRNKAATTYSMGGVIKSFYTYLAKFHGYKNLGQLIYQTPFLPPDQRILTKEEYQKVCDTLKSFIKKPCCDYHGQWARNDLAMFQILCNTGLRASEFLSLSPDNFANGFVRVVGKGRKMRAIPLNGTMRKILEDDPALSFVTARGKMKAKIPALHPHSCRQTINNYCDRIAMKAKIPAFHPHSCRHFFATELWHKGVDMYTISRLLGHSSTAVTELVYVHWSEDSLRGTTDALDEKPAG